MKKIVIGLILLSAAAGGLALLLRRHADSGRHIQTALLRTGTIRKTISTTGAVSAMKTVAVEAHVSGTLARVLIADNQRVRKGDLLAALDKTPFEASVRDSEVSVRNAKEKAEQARDDYRRSLALRDKGLLSPGDSTSCKTRLDASEAALISAESALRRATFNLRRIEIRAPMDGMVIEKDVKAGQTVSGFESPTLFVLAADLSRMQVQAHMEERDSMRIQVGQKAYFTVGAIPGTEFTGVVRQIHHPPASAGNAARCTVMVDAENGDGRLMPGMTATIGFILEEKRKVRLIPNTALDLALPKTFQARWRAPVFFDDGNRDGFPVRPESASSASVEAKAAPRRIFYLDSAGGIVPAPVLTGITDGVNTEVVASRGLDDHARVITGFSGTDKGSAAKSTSEPKATPAPAGGSPGPVPGSSSIL